MNVTLGNVYMNNELDIKNADCEYKVFLQDGFYSHAPIIPKIHKHNYAEMHIILDGCATFSVGGAEYAAQSGELLVIPRRTLHCRSRMEEGTRHTAFQINYDVADFSVFKLSEAILNEFFSEIEKSEKSGNCSTVSSYIALFVTYFRDGNPYKAENITDYGFLINEFFSHRYSEDICLEDLAHELHLSKRQTERLVLIHTGNTFGNELASTRIAISKHLMETTKMSMTEIAWYVGYRSYSGFFKAFKKYESGK
jgi:AraC-like DNA-binding protein